VDADVARAALQSFAIEDGDIRWAAAEIVCAAARNDAGLESHLRLAGDGASFEQRKMALYCLRNIGFRDATLYLRSLDDEHAGVRHAALSGLLRCGDADAATIDRLVRLLANEVDAGVRRAVAVTLGRVMAGNPGALAALQETAALSDDPDLVRAIERSLALGIG
jgi:HEAT repeat protein